MNAATPGHSTARKPTAPARHRRPRCRDCPFCAPTGQCLDRTIRSGRCGDWVYYVLPGNQHARRLWVKPRDPRTPKQRYWRARLGAASRSYSASLTDQQHNACIAAGAKVRSRPRLAQWGWLTGQQYWVRLECKTKAEGRMTKAERPAKGLPTQGISQPTWDAHRGVTVTLPWHYRSDTGRAGAGRCKSEIRGSKAETTPACRGLKTQNPSGAKIPAVGASAPWIWLGFRASAFGFGRSGLRRAVRIGPGGFRLQGCAGGGQAAGVKAQPRQQRAALQRERGPPWPLLEAKPMRKSMLRPRSKAGCSAACAVAWTWLNPQSSTFDSHPLAPAGSGHLRGNGACIRSKACSHRCLQT